MSYGGDVVLLDLFSFFPGLAAGDGEDLIELASMVVVVAGDHREKVVERGGLAPVQPPRLP